MYSGYKLSLQILFVYFLVLPSLLHPSILFNFLYLFKLVVMWGICCLHRKWVHQRKEIVAFQFLVCSCSHYIAADVQLIHPSSASFEVPNMAFTTCMCLHLFYCFFFPILEWLCDPYTATSLSGLALPSWFSAYFIKGTLVVATIALVYCHLRRTRVQVSFFSLSLLAGGSRNFSMVGL